MIGKEWKITQANQKTREFFELMSKPTRLNDYNVLNSLEENGILALWEY